jgi:hypothetical protein
LILCSPRKLCHLAIRERLRKLLKHEECHWHWKPWAPFTNRWRKSSKCGNEAQFVKSKLDARLELALSRQKYMDKFVPMPEQDGPFKNQTC